MAVVPFFGFGSWLIAAPILFIAIVMGIIVLARGGTLHGIFILIISLIVAPVFILVAPFVTSLLGIGGAVAALGTTSAATTMPSSSAVLPTSVPDVGQSSNQQQQGEPAPIIIHFDGDYIKFKHLIQAQTEQIKDLKSRLVVREGPRGFLTGSDQMDRTQREAVQSENYYREQLFTFLGNKLGMTPDAVAAKFAEMASRVDAGTQPSSR